MNRLSEKIEEEIAKCRGDVSIFIKPVLGDTFFSHNPELKMRSASMIKVMVLYALFVLEYQKNCDLDTCLAIKESDRVEGGILCSWYNQPINLFNAAILMITVSDNSAANILIEHLGIDTIQQILLEKGLEKTVLGRKMLDFKAKEKGLDNYTSARDISNVYTLIYKDGRIDEIARKKMLKILSLQKIRNKLPGRIMVDDNDDLDKIIAHKTGELDGVEHDCGLFFPERENPLVVSVMTENLSSRWDGVRLCQNIGKLIYSQYREDGAYCG